MMVRRLPRASDVTQKMSDGAAYFVDGVSIGDFQEPMLSSCWCPDAGRRSRRAVRRVPEVLGPDIEPGMQPRNAPGPPCSPRVTAGVRDLDAFPEPRMVRHGAQALGERHPECRVAAQRLDRVGPRRSRAM